MKTSPVERTAPALLRWVSHGLTLLLSLLLAWLLGFVLGDIGRIQGPDYQAVVDRHVSTNLVQQRTGLGRQIEELRLQIERQSEIQRQLQQSMDNARQTMEQMMELHRLSMEQKLSPRDAEREALATSQTRFLDAQEKFEAANTAIAQSSAERHLLTQQLKTLDEQISRQREPATREFEELRRRHEFKIAASKLLFIVPVLLLSVWLLQRFRDGPFRPIFLALFLASFWRVGVVMFDHFPRRFFKYIAIVAAIAIVLGFLIWLLRRMARPGLDLLLKRYREAYHSHHCPMCAYPIQRGPFKHALWTRKGPRSVLGPEVVRTPDETPYACPACGTVLFEACDQCGKARHSLLPYCESCGAEKAIPQG